MTEIQAAKEAYGRKWAGFEKAYTSPKDIAEAYKRQLLSRWGGFSSNDIKGMSTAQINSELTKRELLYDKSQVIKGGKLIENKPLIKVLIKDLASG